MKTEHHLDMTPGELRDLIGHPAFMARWSDHLDDCDRCYALFEAAVVLPEPGLRHGPAESGTGSRAAATLIAIGRDRRGLVHALSSRLTASGCTIAATRMKMLGGHFTMLLRVLGEADDLVRVREHAAAWGETDGMEIKVHLDPALGALSASRRTRRRIYRLRAVSQKRAGIIDDLTRVIEDAGGDVKWLEATTKREAGGPLYSDVQIHLELARSARRSLLQEIRRLDVRSDDLVPLPAEAWTEPIEARKESGA